MSDWLDSMPTDATSMQLVKAGIEKWREVKFKLDSAEMSYKYAQEQYDKQVQELCQLMRKQGLEGMKLEDGTMLEIVPKIKCSILKDESKRLAVADWLREQGADALVSSTLTVMPSAKAVLEANGVAYDENVAMNTNSVKAWVKGEMEKGNLGIDDLPKGLAWFQWDDISVS